MPCPHDDPSLNTIYLDNPQQSILKYEKLKLCKKHTAFPCDSTINNELTQLSC